MALKTLKLGAFFVAFIVAALTLFVNQTLCIEKFSGESHLKSACFHHIKSCETNPKASQFDLSAKTHFENLCENHCFDVTFPSTFVVEKFKPVQAQVISLVMTLSLLPIFWPPGHVEHSPPRSTAPPKKLYLTRSFFIPLVIRLTV